jgi:hypothetical protein
VPTGSRLTSSTSATFPWPVHFDKLYEPVDTTPPTSTLTIGDLQYSTSGRTYVTSATSLTLTASDAGGVQNVWYRIYQTGSAAPDYTSVAGSIATLYVTGADGQYTLDTNATDDSGNDEKPHTTTVYLDDSGPTITITTPAMGAMYAVDQVLTAAFGCTDGGSGVASCTGSVANGTAVNTSSPGSFTFTVDATDNLGNTSSKTVSYAVSYRICLLYDSTKALGSPNSSVAVKLQLCDASNTNLSSPGIAVTALNVDGRSPRLRPEWRTPGTSSDTTARLRDTSTTSRPKVSPAGSTS